MPTPEFAAIQAIHDFKSLVRYLRKDLHWPVDEEKADDLTFPYRPAELGLDDRLAVKVREIKQLRPLAPKQPWGVFWIDFEPKRLPVVVMRRILSALVRKQRLQRGHRKAWDLPDLMFVSATGTGSERGISFAHFEEVDGKQQLRTFSWDVRETHLYYIEKLNLDALRWPNNSADAAAWRRQWDAAFSVPHRYVPKTAEMLAKEMARIAGEIRDSVEQIYSMEHAGGPLHRLHLNLRLDLISDLSETDFADMYAQTVTYGLFAARATRSGGFTRSDVPALIAHTNPFLRELLEQMMNQQSLDLDELGVSELTDLLGKVDMEAILRNFGMQKKGEDPVIHFYETFMSEYDPEQKVKRGEFYTPDAVVSFIVRSVDFLLKTQFDCPDGLATVAKHSGNFQSTVLDPATGTGTFLKYVIKVIWDTFYERNKKINKADRNLKWNRYVRENVLPRLYGFELKMSPYTIAHMKVGLALQETGFEFREGERLQIYLTNSLQPAHEIRRTDTEALAHEARLANTVKHTVPITVVMGNPPYAGHSANASKDTHGDLTFIGSLVKDYYKVDGKPLGERNSKWLQDDYVKFLRFAQWKVAKTGAGVVGMITNHGYLDNPTFRGMRQQLLQTFDYIYVLDLHGNLKKNEVAPDGSRDQNVFDVQQGVAICLLVKLPTSSKRPRVFHADLFGSQAYKYDWLLTGRSTMASVPWTEIQPKRDYYLFVPNESGMSGEYTKYLPLPAICQVNVLGFQTHRDEIAIADDKNELRRKVTDYLGRSPSSKKWDELAMQCLYRAFDVRWTYYSKEVNDRPRMDVMRHIIGKYNIALVVGRQGQSTGDVEWNVAFVTDKPTDANIYRRGGCNIFPLYLYGSVLTSAQMSMFEGTSSSPGAYRPNISQEFSGSLASSTGLKFLPGGRGDLRATFGPEDVFDYIYAILYSPGYRHRYAEPLKIDFPRLPVTGNVILLGRLCGIGRELISLHLLSVVPGKPITGLRGKGDDVVAPGYPKYEDGRVFINDGQAFEGVPEDVWKFRIGGLETCEKWLKDRRGVKLAKEDIVHFHRVAVALRETIRLMREADAAIEDHGGWPLH